MQTLADGVWHNASSLGLSCGGSCLEITVSPAPASCGGSAQEAAASCVNATRGYYAAWPVVVLYNSAGLPAVPWLQSL